MKTTNIEFDNPEYLQQGSERQQKAYKVLVKSGVFSLPEEFQPILAGTVPIGIDTDGSDLDIVCRVTDRDRFVTVMVDCFGAKEGFTLSRSALPGPIICRFVESGMEIEIYGSESDPHMSAAFRHMIVEDRVLRIAGEGFRQQVIELKRTGVKTEPAFAMLLGLEGDPFAAVLALENMTDESLRQVIFEKMRVK